MTYLISLVALVLAIGAGCLAWRLWTWGRVLQRRVDALEAALGTGTEAVTPESVGEGRLITVEVLNPFEVAMAESRAAGLLGKVRPALLTKMVYDQVSKEILAGLEEAGVAAEVRVHVVG